MRRPTARREIAQVRHPGKGGFYTGLVASGISTALFGLGVAGRVAVSRSDDSDPQDALVDVPLIFGVIGLAISVPQMLRSHAAWRSSVDAFEPPSILSVQVAPTGIRVRF